MLLRRAFAALGTALLAVSAALAPPPAAAQTPAIPEIPYDQFQLRNGLRVIVHEDRSLPVVAVNIWYGVGSRDEWVGGAGFAHLFEHLMFQGSKNFRSDYIAELENLGARDLNGTTSRDRTNYFQTVPTQALDRVLWLESDRMAHLLGGLTHRALQTQKEVVLREKEQGESRPFGRLYGHILRNLYPSGHPYHWETIGYVEDIEAAAPDSIKPWYDVWYRPSNAVLVLAGDIGLEQAREKAEFYFGALPRQPAPKRIRASVPKLRSTQRIELTEAAPFERLYWVWPVPREGGRDAVLLTMYCALLAGGPGRPLWRELVVERQLANFVGCSNNAADLGGELLLYLEAREGVQLDDAAQALRELLDAQFRAKPTPETERLLEAVRGGLWGGLMRRLEAVGGFGGRSDLLAAGAMMEGDPGAYKRELEWVRDATLGDLYGAGKRWMKRKYLDFRIRRGRRMDPVPGEGVGPWIEPPRGKAAQKEARPSYRDPVVRSVPPSVAAAEPPRVPKVERTQLGNGLQVLLLRRENSPLVSAEIHFATGRADDPDALKGAAGFGAHMLMQGTLNRSAGQLRTDLQALAADLDAFADLHHSGLKLSLPIHNLDRGMDIMREVLLDPAFHSYDINRERARWLARITREKRSPRGRALRELPPLLFGAQHPYGVPLSDAGVAEHLREIGYPDLTSWHARLLVSPAPKLILVGDLDLQQARDLAQRHFGNLRLRSRGTASNPATLETAEASHIYLRDNQVSGPQAVLFFGTLLPPMDPADASLDAHSFLFNEVVGGSFQSRLNTLIREEKGWSYGARAYLLPLRTQTMLVVLTQVPVEKAAEATTAILQLMRDASTALPPAPEEFAPHQRSAGYRLATGLETSSQYLNWLAELVRRDRTPDYSSRYGKALAEVNVHSMARHAQKRPLTSWTALIVGDTSKMEGSLRRLGIPLTKLED